jgi:hypothetical protein
VFNTPLSATELQAIVVFFSFAVGYTVYYFIFHSQSLHDWFHARFDTVPAELWRNTLYRLVQVLAMGVVPGALLVGLTGSTLPEFGLVLQWSWPRAAVIAGLCLVVVAVIWINPGKHKLAGSYPQMRISQWRLEHVALNVLTWAAYLLAYELMFRGFMLYVLLPYGVWVAVSVNIAIYVLAHIPKGLSEAVGAIPFGLLVCALTLAYGSIWAAFWLHLALALANSFVALAVNPEMRLARRGQ